MRMLLAATAAAWLSGPGVLFAQAAPYPNKPVRYLIPFTAGDSPDIVGRLLSERLYKLWGQTVVVENRVGAGGTVGAEVAAKAPADGYTLFQCNIASNAIALSLYATLPYGSRDFVAISRIATTSSVLIARTRPKSPRRRGFRHSNAGYALGLAVPLRRARRERSSFTARACRPAASPRRGACNSRAALRIHLSCIKEGPARR